MESRTRVVDVAPVTDGWRFVRVHWKAAPILAGQVLDLHTETGHLALAVSAASLKEDWIGGVLPPGTAPSWLRPGLAGAGRLTLQGLEPGMGPGAVVFADACGIGPALYLAQHAPHPPRVVLLDGTQGVPARLRPSRFMVPGVAAEAIAAVGMLEELECPSRIAVPEGRPGCQEDTALEMLRGYLSAMAPPQRSRTRLIAFVRAGALSACESDLRAAVEDLRIVEIPVARSA